MRFMRGALGPISLTAAAGVITLAILKTALADTPHSVFLLGSTLLWIAWIAGALDVALAAAGAPGSSRMGFPAGLAAAFGLASAGLVLGGMGFPVLATVGILAVAAEPAGRLGTMRTHELPGFGVGGLGALTLWLALTALETGREPLFYLSGVLAVAVAILGAAWLRRRSGRFPVGGGGLLLASLSPGFVGTLLATYS